MRYIKLIIAVAAVFLSYSHAIAGEDYRPRNIRIDVEYRQSGESGRGIGAAQWRTGKNSSYSKQFIVVLDGFSASIFVGEEVPFVNFYRTFLFEHGYIVEEEEVVIKDIGTKLKVEPRIVGNNAVEITLTPEISFVRDRKRRTIDIKTLSTTVIAADGQSIPIGGLQKDAEFDKYFFSAASQSDLEIILTPHIQ
ncbi:MAG: hypothetical protein PHO67_08570 [Candidatus Omnitrophica bacterium]|nr:hypothetical protein [Candidatus Omnitrophota bacterium]MDD5547189.1 hypothetical protein [Candidatus Omnitrophota bacterium]